jgi:hypothetical protein
LPSIRAQPFLNLQAIDTSRSARSFPPSRKESHLSGNTQPSSAKHNIWLYQPHPNTLQIPSKYKDQAADIGEDNMVDTMTGTGVNDSGTFRERSLKALTKAWNAKCNSADHVQRCLGRERRMNSTRSDTGEGSFKGDVLQNEASCR